MRAVITGGAGFIGSYLAELLLQEGIEILLIDNFQVGSATNLVNVVSHPRCRVVQEDLLNATALTPLFKNIDWVFHLGALADAPASHHLAPAYFQVNVAGTLNVLEAAKTHNVKRLIYAASAACYGLHPQCPTNEEAPIVPGSPYALTKHMGEELVLSWAQIYHLPALSLRLFNVYGPRSLNKGTVFSIFLEQKLKGLPFTVTGDGKQSRDFVYVTDVARAFYLAAQSSLVGEVFNVGSAQHCQVSTLVDLLGGTPVYLPERPGDPKVSLADISKIKKHLLWEPQVSLKEGVAQVLAGCGARG